MDLTKEEMRHIIILCDSDIIEGKSAIRNTPKASLLHEEWKKCFKIDYSIIKKIEAKIKEVQK